MSTQPPPPPPAPLPAAKRKGLLDEDLLSSYLGELIEKNGVIELRVLGAATATSGWGARPQTYSGFFDDKDAAVNALTRFSAWKGAYATLNPVLPDLLARANNRLGADDSTKDHEVTRRTQLLIDVDPVRPAGISSTEEEHEAAIQRARDVAEYLSDEPSWPEPTLIDSGNGAHLRFAIDLPRDDTALVRRVLQAISSLFSDERLEVDTSVHNPSRIARIPGTRACKGDSTADRPHRMAKVLFAPEQAEVVPQERLEQIAGLLVERRDDRQEREELRSPGSASRAAFDVPAFLQRHGIGVRKHDLWRGGSRWVLETSPLCLSHGPDSAAFIVQFPSGALAAGCHHESCTWEWRDLRAHLEPELKHDASQHAERRSRAGLGIRPGCVVRAADRDNFGTVSSVNSDRGTAFVDFESRDGHAANVELPLEQLTVTSGGSASRNILASPRQYEFYDLAALLGAKPPHALVTGILDEGNVAVLYGAPASFKSFVALDLALTLTTGTAWKRAAHETQECNVVLFSGEGQAGLGRRICAWLLRREEELGAAGVDPSGLREVVQRRFRAAGEAIPLIDASEPETVMAALEELTKDLDGSPKLIVLDTLARCFLGGDENSARDMGTFIEACDEIRKRTGAAVLLVHHTGKDGDLERGSSALRAGADVMIKAEREDDGSKDGGQVVLTFEKRKDGPGAEDMVIDLHPVRFEDADGESHSSLAAGLEVGRAAVVRSADTRGRGRRQKRSTPAEHQRLEILHCLANVFDLERATANKLKECTGIPRSSVQKQLAVLRKDGRVEITPDGRTFIYTITDKGRESLSPTSPSSSESETKGGRLPSPTSPPHPLRGGGDDTETETRATDGECDG